MTLKLVKYMYFVTKLKTRIRAFPKMLQLAVWNFLQLQFSLNIYLTIMNTEESLFIFDENEVSLHSNDRMFLQVLGLTLSC